jgi:hypothetical protein
MRGGRRVSTLTVSYHDPRRSPVVFMHVDKMTRDGRLIWLEFKALPGYPDGGGVVLQTEAVKEIKIHDEENP